MTYRQPIETAPEDRDILLLIDDDDTNGEYWITGWKSARAWRTNYHVTAKPLAWAELPKGLGACAPQVNVESGKSE
jgi:hypothetical protein